MREEAEKGAQNAGGWNRGGSGNRTCATWCKGSCCAANPGSRKPKRLAQQQEDLRRKLGAVADRCQMLQSLEQEYEGFGRSVKQTLQAADKGGAPGHPGGRYPG